MRVTIYLTDEQVDFLKAYCQEERISRAAAIRRGIQLLLDRDKKRDSDRVVERRRAVDAAFGMWKDRRIDAVEYQRKLRAEWDR